MLRRIYFLFISIILFSITSGSFEAFAQANKKFTVVIDAGHGGKDIGATDNGVMEKNINLQVARQLESLIKKKLKNTKVVMTRDDDTYLTLQQRADKANKAQGDIFISIHTNSVDKKNPNRKTVAGSSVYTLGLHKDENNLEVARRENSVIELEKNYQQNYSGFDPQKDESYIIFEMAQKKNLSQSIKFAENVEKELVKSGRKDRGVHQAGFWVLWATSMPSVLVELDFICNPESAKYISSEKGAKEMAEAIFNAVKAYESSWTNSMKSTKLKNSSKDKLAQEETTVFDNPSIDQSAVAVARTKTREKKTVKQPVASVTTASKNSGKRKRRSNYAKGLSENVSYEKSNINIGVSKQTATTVETAVPTVELASKETKTTKKNPDGKKSQAKKKKDSSKETKIKETKVKAPKADNNTTLASTYDTKKSKRHEAHSAKLNKLETVYKIQIMASTDLLNLSSSCFCGLSPITTYKENNIYKYYYGESTDKEEVEELLADVRKKIPDAFIVSSKKTVQTKK